MIVLLLFHFLFQTEASNPEKNCCNNSFMYNKKIYIVSCL